MIFFFSPSFIMPVHIDALRVIGRIFLSAVLYGAAIYTLVFVFGYAVPWLYTNPKAVLSIGYLLSLPLGVAGLSWSIWHVHKMRPVVPDLIAGNVFLFFWFICYVIGAPLLIWEDYVAQFIHCTPIEAVPLPAFLSSK